MAPPQPPLPPIRTELEHRFAEIAHDAWRLKMLDSGWAPTTTPTSPARGFDAQQREHDALRPFSELDPVDQRETRHTVLGIVTLKALAEAVRYRRGPDREFRSREMSKGLRVLSEDGKQSGRIESWTTSPDGVFVEWIEVLWDDDTELRTHASERAIRRTNGG